MCVCVCVCVGISSWEQGGLTQRTEGEGPHRENVSTANTAKCIFTCTCKIRAKILFVDCLCTILMLNKSVSFLKGVYAIAGSKDCFW